MRWLLAPLVALLLAAPAAANPPIPGADVPMRQFLGVPGSDPPACETGEDNVLAFLPGDTSFTPPTGVTCVTVHIIPAGGNGETRGQSTGSAEGGSTGGYAGLVAYTVTPGVAIPLQVAAGGSEAQTWFASPSIAMANGGLNGVLSASGTPAPANGVGDIVFPGTKSGNSNTNGGSGGAGAGGPDGSGKTSGDTTAGSGASGGGAVGGISSTASPNVSTDPGGAGGVGPNGDAGGAGCTVSTAAQLGANGSGPGGGCGQGGGRAGRDGSQYNLWQVTQGPNISLWFGPGSGGSGGNNSGSSGSIGGNGGGCGGAGGGARVGGTGAKGCIIVTWKNP